MKRSRRVRPRFFVFLGLVLLTFVLVLAHHSGPPPSKPAAASGHKPTTAGTAGKPQATTSASAPQSGGSTLPWQSHHANPYLPGDLLIADSMNHRVLLVTPGKRIVWQFPKPGTTPNRRFQQPDDAFFTPHFNNIITNEEDYQVISVINIKSGQVAWEYGHFGQQGSAPGYLNYPDDAFLFQTPTSSFIKVADIRNQRILFINYKTQAITQQYGKTGVQVANPPTTWNAPNGAFPAPGQGTLVTQIGGQDAVLLNKAGQVVWTLHFPYYYPSDANFTPHGNIIVAFYTNPGKILKMTPSGKILWQYNVQSGPGKLNQPSLAVELPNGMIAANDDANDRVIIIDPKTNKIVWQYGHTSQPGSAPGYLNIPDGIDFLPPGVVPGNNNPDVGHLWSYPGNGY